MRRGNAQGPAPTPHPVHGPPAVYVGPVGVQQPAAPFAPPAVHFQPVLNGVVHVPPPQPHPPQQLVGDYLFEPTQMHYVRAPLPAAQDYRAVPPATHHPRIGGAAGDIPGVAQPMSYAQARHVPPVPVQVHGSGVPQSNPVPEPRPEPFSFPFGIVDPRGVYRPSDPRVPQRQGTSMYFPSGTAKTPVSSAVAPSGSCIVSEPSKKLLTASVATNMCHGQKQLQKQSATTATKGRSKPRRAPRPSPPKPKDPDVDFPVVGGLCEKVPSSSTGDLVQIWDFVHNFSNSLGLSSVSPFLQFERAISMGDEVGSMAVLDAVVVRLVYCILDDESLVDELNFEEDIVSKLQEIKPTKRWTVDCAKDVFKVLPTFVSYDGEDSDHDDQTLERAVRAMDTRGDRRSAFYLSLEPADRVRILRELVDYASVSDALVSCVHDSLEHAEEEKKKARDEHLANRRRLEGELKALREELRVVKERVVDRNQKLEEAKAIELKSKSQQSKKSAKGKGLAKKQETVDNTAIPSDPGCTTRKKRLEDLRLERQTESARRTDENLVQSLESKIDRAKDELRVLRESKVKNVGESSKPGNGNVTNSHSSGSAQKVTAQQSSTSAVAKKKKKQEKLYDSKGLKALQNPDGTDPIRTFPIGIDRKNRAYWFFPDIGRLWIETVEKVENGTKSDWLYFSSMGEIEQLQKWLSPLRSYEMAVASAIKIISPALERNFAKTARFKASLENAKRIAKLAEEMTPEDSAGVTAKSGRRRRTLPLEASAPAVRKSERVATLNKEVCNNGRSRSRSRRVGDPSMDRAPPVAKSEVREGSLESATGTRTRRASYALDSAGSDQKTRARKRMKIECSDPLTMSNVEVETPLSTRRATRSHRTVTVSELAKSGEGKSQNVEVDGSDEGAPGVRVSARISARRALGKTRRWQGGEKAANSESEASTVCLSGAKTVLQTSTGKTRQSSRIRRSLT